MNDEDRKPRIIVVYKVDGIEMGVMEEGTPFLTERGLAALCGVSTNTIITIGNDFSLKGHTKRDAIIAKVLADYKYFKDYLFVYRMYRNKKIRIHPVAVCGAVLEYYAFETTERRETALRVHRLLSRKGLRVYIYDKLGYDPRNLIPDKWKEYRYRLAFTFVSPGCFSVFKEYGELVLSSIREGVRLSDTTLPDVELGRVWSKYWDENFLEEIYGERRQEPNSCPDYFKHACANEVNTWVYPIESLSLFRHWLAENYLGVDYPHYLKELIDEGELSATSAEILAVMRKRNPNREAQ